MPSWGIVAAAATLVGQNLGAGRPERAERAVWMAGAYNTAFLAAVAVCFFSVARPLVSLFHQRRRSGAGGRGLPAIRKPGLSVLCLGNDCGAGLQRGRRYGDADVDEFLLLLAAADSAVTGPGTGGKRCWVAVGLTGLSTGLPGRKARPPIPFAASLPPALAGGWLAACKWSAGFARSLSTICFLPPPLHWRTAITRQAGSSPHRQNRPLPPLRP